MSTCTPRRSWQSSITAPTCSRGREDRGADVGLADLLDHRRGRACRTGECTIDLAAVGERDLVLHVRRGGEQLEVVLALEPLAHDVHVEQAEEPAAEAEAERLARLGLAGERGVVQRQLLERVAQVRELVGVDREEAAEHHRLDLAVAGQRLRRRAALRGQRVAHAQQRDVLDAGDQVAHLARAQRLDRASSAGRRSRSRRCRPRCRSAWRRSGRPCAARRPPPARRPPRRGTGRTRSRRSAPAGRRRRRPRAAGCAARSPRAAPPPRRPSWRTRGSRSSGSSPSSSSISPRHALGLGARAGRSC